MLEKRALQAQFEEAMKRVQRSAKEIKELKAKQDQDTQERDAFCSKIEQLEKELSQTRSELDFERERAMKETERADQLESGANIPAPVFQKVLDEFFASDAWFNAQKDLRITAGTHLSFIFLCTLFFVNCNQLPICSLFLLVRPRSKGQSSQEVPRDCRSVAIYLM